MFYFKFNELLNKKIINFWKRGKHPQFYLYNFNSTSPNIRLANTYQIYQTVQIYDCIDPKNNS